LARTENKKGLPGGETSQDHSTKWDGAVKKRSKGKGVLLVLEKRTKKS